jgi:general stress protein 26
MISLDQVPGLEENFKKARVVFLTTFSETGEAHVRQMTNLNEDPFKMMWFTSYTDSRKVEDVKRNPRVVIAFPSERRGDFFEIEGRAELERREVVEEKWDWWYLYWRPEQADMFWFPRNENHPEWTIINVYLVSARVVKRG